ncbi:MAG: glycosidase [Patescibacteria group bacterium]|nr:glycosidase [Patescibacteria group bacterium]
MPKESVKKITKKRKTASKAASKTIQSRKKPDSGKKTGKKPRERKKPSLSKLLVKAEENPIISPSTHNGWETWQTFNPGVILLDDKVHFLYRAIGEDAVSRLGYASSTDGLTIDERHPRPVYEHQISAPVFNPYSFASGGSFGGSEDPRLVKVDGDDRVYMTYTACDGGLGVALTSLPEKSFLQKKWKWKKPVLISPPGEVHKNWVIFPEKIHGRYAILHSISPDISIDYRDDLDFKNGEYIKSFYNPRGGGKMGWESWIRGAGAPPIKTRDGWLLFYHAMDKDDPWKYKVGAMLLDLDDPTKILYRSREPILEPEEKYENNGFKSGVVYVSGAIVKGSDLFVYYGAADSYVGVARTKLNDFLNELTKGEKVKLEPVKIVKNKKNVR